MIVSEPSIRDIPRIKEMLDQAKSMEALKTISPVLLSLLRFIGVDVTPTESALRSLGELRQTIEEMASIPDRFNDLFSEQGWIMYDQMNVSVAKGAMAKAEAGDMEGAEALLVDYYNLENVQWQLLTMRGVEAFRPRMALAEMALTDYEEGRYHACIPVVLALLDGLVNELHEKRRGFFSDKVDLTAWDSIAAHEKGLNALSKIFQKGRYKTTTEQIRLPYRHGIMHGMDLGYANKTVAAKCWAALFAVRDWALKSESGLIEAPPPKPEKSWSDLFRQISETEETKKRIAAWTPRQVTVGKDVPTTGEPAMFIEGTPERKLVEFLRFWKTRNYGRMAEYLPGMSGPINKAAGEVREFYVSLALEKFEIEEITDKGPFITNLKVRLCYISDGEPRDDVVDFRLFCEDTEGRLALSETQGAQWRLTTWPLL
ncbi:MAG TPA: hypothetical protein VN696_05645 [Pyrinomonadaceae bacterium]|nr:hypothetical protein [Pyrinomonadaceae bacterium]